MIGSITVLCSSLNVRKGPSVDYQVIRSIKKGTIHPVYETRNGWHRVGDNEWCSGGTAYVTFKACNCDCGGHKSQSTGNSNNSSIGVSTTALPNDVNPTVVWDAGHGGNDSGALGGGQKEKDWTLKMSIYQHNRCKQLGIKSALSRSTDKTIELNARANQIKNMKAKLCISNHMNSDDNVKAKGAETIYSVYGDGKLANNILVNLGKCGRTKRRAYTRKNSKGQDWYAMHRLTGNVKTVIVEYEFICNVPEFTKFANDWQNHAEAVLQAVCEDLGVKYKR